MASQTDSDPFTYQGVREEGMVDPARPSQCQSLEVSIIFPGGRRMGLEEEDGKSILKPSGMMIRWWG